MKLDFKHGPDRNGNMIYLRIDTDARTYTGNRILLGGVKVTRAEIRALRDQARADGYTEE